MDTIYIDTALYTLMIDCSFIGAAFIYVIWKHIDRYLGVINDEEICLEAVLSCRAEAVAAAQRGNRVDCTGTSKGLIFCGLLFLVASLICSIYIPDVSHCALMVLSILAILIGFRLVQSLEFRSEEQSYLCDILFGVSAFGLLTHAVFSVIAGGMGALTHKPNLLGMITGCLSILQVIIQLLFIADVSRRRAPLPEEKRCKPALQVVTFLLICNATMWLIYTVEFLYVLDKPVELDFDGLITWFVRVMQRFTLPLCSLHRFHSAITLTDIWKISYKARVE